MSGEQKCQQFGSLGTSNGSSSIGYAGRTDLKVLIASGHVDTLLTSTEDGLSPFPKDLIESELKIPKRELYDWAGQVCTGTAVTLTALPSRHPGSGLKGVILMPFGTSECYKALVAPEHRGLPYHDFYYNVTFEAILWAARHWGSRRIATTHLSGCGQPFHPDIPLTQCEAILHASHLPEPVTLEHFCFLGCACFRAEVFVGFEGKLRTLSGEHRPIDVSVSDEPHGVAVLTLKWTSSSKETQYGSDH